MMSWLTKRADKIVPLPVSGAMLTHPGSVREANEDSVAYVVPRDDDMPSGLMALAIVADGMGGHAAGEVASRIAVDTLLQLFQETPGEVPDLLDKGLRRANTAIQDYAAEHPECEGMGTTCTIIAIKDNRAFLGHIGDSRAYILREGKLHQISEDHSLVAALVRSGTITESEAETRPDRNMILQALGTRPTIDPLIWDEGLPLLTGDVLMLCSDGLSDLVGNPAIAETMGKLRPYDACQSLVNQANGNGGHDNISVGVIAIVPPEVEPEAVEETTRITRPMALSVPEEDKS